MDRKMPRKVCNTWLERIFWQNAALGDVLQCIAEGSDVKERSKDGKTPLHMAAIWGRVEVVQALLDAGACVRLLDNQGFSPLYHAVNRGEVKMVRALLKAGSDADIRCGGRKLAPLYVAAKRGDDEVVQMLLDAGAETEVRQTMKSMTPLHFAAAWGNVGSIRALLEAGADAGARDARGMIPQAYAPVSAQGLLEVGSDDRPRTMQRDIENQNIMLYWDDAPPPEVSAVVEKWRKAFPAWNVALFDEKAACHFLLARFGGEIARIFRRCRLHAMRSDFFRVFWAMSEGGIYSDVAFVPRRDPLFFNPAKDITVITEETPSTLLNGLFYSKKNSKELKLVAYEMIQAISQERIPNIELATGPAAWSRALGQRETTTMAILRADIRLHIERSGYTKQMRPEETHWNKMQKRMSIYQKDNSNAMRPAEMTSP